MRVLHVNKFLYRRGGAEGYMEDLADLQTKQGDEVAFFGMAHPENVHVEYAASFPSKVDFDPIPSDAVGKARSIARMFWSSSARSGIADVVDDFRPDVVHLHNIYHQLSPSILGPLAKRNIATVMTLHDYKLACPTYQLLDQGELCEACLPNKFHNAVIRRCRGGSIVSSGLMAAELAVHTGLRSYGAVGVFICPSRFLADTMVKAKVFPDRMHVLNHFVDVRDIAPKTEPGANVVFGGRLAAEKGVDTLIEAWKQVPEPLVLHIAGDGPERERLERLAAPQGERIVFHGRMPKAALFDLMRSCAVAAVPSRWHENQPMSVIEAFGLGLPVVTTMLGGLPELVTPGVEGALVPHEDPGALATALTDLAADPVRAFEMGKVARARIERDFSIEAHLAGMSRMYDLATQRARRR